MLTSSCRSSMNEVYIYEGTFRELLMLISSLIVMGITPSDIVQKDNYEPNLFEEIRELKLSERYRIYDNFKTKLPSSTLKTCYRAFMSEERGVELAIFYFLKNALKYGEEIFARRNLRCVNRVLELANRVGRENHKFKGFLRFREMKDGMLYAEINPTNNVLSLLTEHFRKRFANRRFLIRDVKRDIWAYYDGMRVHFYKWNISGETTSEYSDEEKEIASLWKTFFKTIGIRERENRRNQMGFMPKKYWNYIIEMEDEK